MRIGIDYVPAATHAPGVGRYVRELVRALVRLDSCPNLALFDLRVRPACMSAASLGIARATGARKVPRRLRLPVPTRGARALASIGLGADRLLGDIDIFHRVRPLDPPLGKQCLTTLAVSELPPAGSAAEKRARDVLARSDHLFCFSAAYAKRLLDLDFAAERVHQVPVGAEHWRRDLGDSVPGPELSPPRIVVLGACREARQPERLAAALERLLEGGQDFLFEWLGRQPAAAASILQRFGAGPLGSRCKFRPAPSESELARTVAGAAVLVHLSPDEGTAVTPLEALCLGTSVVASRLPAFVECLEGAALWAHEVAADPQGEQLTEMLVRGIERGQNPLLREQQRTFAAPYTWEATAQATLSVWESMVRTQGTGS